MAFRLPILRPVKEIEGRIPPDSYGVNPTQYDEMPGTGDVGFGALPEPPSGGPSTLDYGMAPGYGSQITSGYQSPTVGLQQDYYPAAEAPVYPPEPEPSRPAIGPSQWEGFGYEGVPGSSYGRAFTPTSRIVPEEYYNPDFQPAPEPSYEPQQGGILPMFGDIAGGIGEAIGDYSRDTIVPYLIESGGDWQEAKRAWDQEQNIRSLGRKPDLLEATLSYPGLPGLGIQGTLKPSLRVGAKLVGEAVEGAGSATKLRLGRLATEETGAMRFGGKGDLSPEDAARKRFNEKWAEAYGDRPETVSIPKVEPPTTVEPSLSIEEARKVAKMTDDELADYNAKIKLRLTPEPSALEVTPVLPAEGAPGKLKIGRVKTTKADRALVEGEKEARNAFKVKQERISREADIEQKAIDTINAQIDRENLRAGKLAQERQQSKALSLQTAQEKLTAKEADEALISEELAARKAEEAAVAKEYKIGMQEAKTAELRAEAGLTEEMQGPGMAKGTPTEMVREIERKAKGPTVEERAAMPRNTQQTIYKPGDFEETAKGVIGQLQPDYHATLADKVFEASQRVPIIRNIMHFSDPTAAAVGQLKQGDPIALAMAKRDAYATVEADASRAAVMDWVGRNRKVLGIDGKGYARNVEISEAAKLVKPEGAVQRLDDIMENMASYRLTPEQATAMTQIKHTFDAMLEAQLKAGIDIHEAKDYWGRIVTKAPQGQDVKVKLKGHTKARSFEGVQEGIAAGYQYADPITALQERLIHGVQTIARKKSMDLIKSLGETPTERFKLSSEAPGLIANQQAAKKTYILTRNLAKKGQATTSELARARKQFKVATQTFNRERLKIGKARPEESERFGRIYSPEIAKAIDAYRVTDPGVVDQFFAIERASMVTGDFSQALVQGTTLLARNPVAWFKAMGYSLAATVRAPESYIVKNIDLITDGIRAGAISAPKEFMLAEGGKLPQMIASAPVVKQTQRAFEWFALVGQAEMWRAVKGMEKTGAAKTELASSVRKSLGVVNRYGLTSKEKGIEKALAFAPRFTIAISTIMTDAVRGGIRGAQARKTLGAVLAGGTSVTIAGQLAYNGKMPNLDDPDQKNWMSIDTKEGTINVFGPFFPYMRAFAQMAKRTSEGDTKGALEAATMLGRGKTSLRFGPLIDFMMGETATGYPVKTGPEGVFEAYLGRVGPMGPKQILEHGQKVVSGENLPMPAVGGEVFGLRTSPYTLSQRRNQIRDEIAMAFPGSEGRKWADLPPDMQKKVNEDSRLQEMVIKGQSLRLNEPTSTAQLEKERNETDNRMRGQLPEPVRKEVERLAVNIGVARSGEGYRYNDERYQHYQDETVKLAGEVLSQFIGTPGFKDSSIDVQKARIARVIDTVRDEVRKTVDTKAALPEGTVKSIINWEAFKETVDDTRADFAKLPGLPADMKLGEVGKTISVAEGVSINLSYAERTEYQKTRSKYIEQLYPKAAASSRYKGFKSDDDRKAFIEKYVTGPAGEHARSDIKKRIGTPEIKRRVEAQRQSK